MLTLEAETRLGELAVSIEIEVRPGECLALAGPSGAGKTSVLRIAAGLLRPDRGRVTCAGETWLDETTDVPPERRRCGFVFQDYALFPHMTAARNVAYALPKHQKHAAHELLERFDLASRAGAHPRELSGGERQRVALARALASSPHALLLDEPLSALDARTRARAGRELGQALREAGVPTVLVTHDFAEASLLGDRVAVMDGGKIVQEGSAAELASRAGSAFVADFTGAVVLTGAAHPAEDVTRVELDGGGWISSTDAATGRVAASVHPWDIAIASADAQQTGSAQNHLQAEVASITVVGSRVRLGLEAGQPLAAEVTATAVRELRLERGSRVTATWKAAATRLTAA